MRPGTVITLAPLSTWGEEFINKRGMWWTVVEHCGNMLKLSPQKAGFDRETDCVFVMDNNNHLKIDRRIPPNA